MKFIELRDAFSQNVIYVNVESINILTPTNCTVDGKCIEGCTVTYNIGSSVSSTTITKTCREVIDTIIDHDLITFKGKVTKIPPFDRGYLETLQTLREHLKPKPSPQETPPQRTRPDLVLIDDPETDNKQADPLFSEKVIEAVKGSTEVVKSNRRGTLDLLEQISTEFKSDTQEKSFNWDDYRPLERGEKIYPSDRTKMNERVSLCVQSEFVGTSFSLKKYPQVYRQYVFQPGDTVQHITPHDRPIYKVIRMFEDLAGHLYCDLEGRKQSVRVKELVLHTPPFTLTLINLQVRPTPPIVYTPGKTPSCNGNGEAQSTEE
jgi:hypothetical protein